LLWRTDLKLKYLSVEEQKLKTMEKKDESAFRLFPFHNGTFENIIPLKRSSLRVHYAIKDDWRNFPKLIFHYKILFLFVNWIGFNTCSLLENIVLKNTWQIVVMSHLFLRLTSANFLHDSRNFYARKMARHNYFFGYCFFSFLYIKIMSIYNLLFNIKFWENRCNIFLHSIYIYIS